MSNLFVSRQYMICFVSSLRFPLLIGVCFQPLNVNQLQHLLKANFVGLVILPTEEESHNVLPLCDSSFVGITKAVTSSIKPLQPTYR
jgi:hypothetical protein